MLWIILIGIALAALTYVAMKRNPDVKEKLLAAAAAVGAFLVALWGMFPWSGS